VGEAHGVFGIIVFAFAAAGSGVFSNEVLFEGASIQSFKFPIAGYVLICLLLFLGPLLMFSLKLRKVKKRGLLKYGTLGTTYTGLFEEKWVDGTTSPGEPILGSADIQSLADYGSSYELVSRMRIFPFEPRTAVGLALTALIPFVPLAAMVMPIQDMLKLVLKVLG
jgi:hypothetical protein